MSPLRARISDSCKSNKYRKSQNQAKKPSTNTKKEAKRIKSDNLTGSNREKWWRRVS